MLVILLLARGVMATRQVLTLKIEVRVLAGEPAFAGYEAGCRRRLYLAEA